MIKGVNKKVLEINNPQSIYFEKAVLYLKPNMSNAPEKLISREANELIRSMSPKPPKYVFWLKLLLYNNSRISGVGFWYLFTFCNIILISSLCNKIFCKILL